MKIMIRKILYIIFLLSFFKPDYFAGTESKLNIVFNLASWLSILIIFITYLNKVSKDKKISKEIIYIILFCLICILSTLINSSSNIINVIYDNLKIISVCFLFDMGVKNDKNIFLKTSLIFFEILVIINFITMILYPHGMWISPTTGYWQNWFLGYDNNHINTFIPLIFINYIYDATRYNKLTPRFYLNLILVNASAFLTWSATSVVAIAIIDIYLILAFFGIRLFKKIYMYVISYIVIFFSVIIFRVQDLFSFLIVAVLKKDLTFSGRIYIWNYVQKFISMKPILGYGIQESSIRYNISSVWKSYHAHNFILEIMYRGGIVLLFITIMIFKNAIKKIKNSKNNLRTFFGCILFIYLLLFLTEFFEPIHYMFIILTIYNIDCFNKEEKNE